MMSVLTSVSVHFALNKAHQESQVIQIKHTSSCFAQIGLIKCLAPYEEVKIRVNFYKLCFIPNRDSLELARSRPITVIDNERFTVQSVITKLVCPVFLVSIYNGVTEHLQSSCHPRPDVGHIFLNVLLVFAYRWHSC